MHRFENYLLLGSICIVCGFLGPFFHVSSLAEQRAAILKNKKYYYLSIEKYGSANWLGDSFWDFCQVKLLFPIDVGIKYKIYHGPDQIALTALLKYGMVLET